VFTSSITGLTAGATYHLRAYAINSAGPAYGNDVTFTTTAPVAATVTTTAVTAITTTTAATGGNVTADGFSAVTAKGVCWSTSANPTILGSKTTDGTGTGSFVSNLTGLTAGTIYHVRAYATNGVTTSYGADVQFTTTGVVVPTVTTTVLSAIDLTSVTSGGNVTSDGNGTVSARGVCWATTANPQVGVGNFTTNGTGTGSFTSNVTGLTQGTLYYVRAYATNSAGIGYGSQLTFTTNLGDVDGNSYKTVLVGTQIWMAENLRTLKLNDNTTAIPNVTDNTAWSTLATPAYCWFQNDITNRPIYGALYNWFTVNTGLLCPAGWKVPTDADFTVLESYLGIPTDSLYVWGYRGTISRAGEKMKSTTGWAPGENGTNTTGLSALPGGYRYAADGTFQALGQWFYWWTASEVLPQPDTRAWYRRLDGSNSWVYRAATEQRGGKYIRCLKN
jgi:uncharacterized protein (TIGR02145 family)